MNPATVATRLAILRDLYVPETIDEARARLARERPPDASTFGERVARNLDELRALDDLARHLRRARARR